MVKERSSEAEKSSVVVVKVDSVEEDLAAAAKTSTEANVNKCSEQIALNVETIARYHLDLQQVANQFYVITVSTEMTDQKEILVLINLTEVEEEISTAHKCTAQSVMNVKTNAKFLSDRLVTNQYFAANVSAAIRAKVVVETAVECLQNNLKCLTLNWTESFN